MFHDEADSYPEPGEYEYRAYFKKGIEPWALLGFTVLDFEENGHINVSYIDENGYTHKVEVLD